MIVASFQAKAQYSLYLGNKTYCDMSVEIVLCNNDGMNITIDNMTQQTLVFAGPIAYFKVFFDGNTSADFVISSGIWCPPQSEYSSGDACYDGYDNYITGNKHSFAVYKL